MAGAGFDCEVLTNYADRRLGLKRRVETGLDWVFGLVDEAIILEDDCHPHPTFFGFCEELLARYRTDPRVTTISGSNFGQGADIADASYFFSRYPLIWGWATWARAWRHYSPDLAAWPELDEQGWLNELFDDPQAVQYWTYIFGQRRDLEDTWDAGWLFGSWLAGGLAAVPCRNLVTNRGFGEHSTNTKTEYRGLFSDVPAVAIDVAAPPSAPCRTRTSRRTSSSRTSCSAGTSDGCSNGSGRSARSRRRGDGSRHARDPGLLAWRRGPRSALAGRQHQHDRLADPRRRADAGAAPRRPAPTVLEGGAHPSALDAADVVLVHFWNTPELYEFLRGELPPVRLAAWAHVAGNSPPQIVTRELVELVDVVRRDRSGHRTAARLRRCLRR